jgi:ribosomal protein L37AE/L43A
MSEPYRPDFVEVLDNSTEGGPRLHGRCPHCKEVVVTHAARETAQCRACTATFALLDILPLTRVAS